MLMLMCCESWLGVGARVWICCLQQLTQAQQARMDDRLAGDRRVAGEGACARGVSACVVLACMPTIVACGSSCCISAPLPWWSGRNYHRLLAQTKDSLAAPGARLAAACTIAIAPLAGAAASATRLSSLPNCSGRRKHNRLASTTGSLPASIVVTCFLARCGRVSARRASDRRPGRNALARFRGQHGRAAGRHSAAHPLNGLRT
jgi:hypothetical protein